ncbi:MAG: ATP-binding protein [Rhodothermales bacterium]
MLYRMRVLPVFGLLWLLLLGAGEQVARAQQIQTLAQVRADANSDTLPDALRDTVYVEGTVQVAAGVLRTEPRVTIIHDGTAGMEVLNVPFDLDLQAGDQVRVKAIVQQTQGNAFLQGLEVERLSTTEEIEPAVSIALAPEVLEAHEGTLVKLRGTLVGMGDVPNGSYVTIGNERSTVVVFAFESGTTGIRFDDFSLGEHVTVTGIVGQFDREMPFDAGYQLYPRGQEDISVSLLPPRFFLILLLGVWATALLSGLWIYLLRKRVRQRVAELRASEARYTRLFDHVTIPIAIHTIEGGKPVLVEMNRTAEHTFGYDLAALQQRSWLDLVGMKTRRVAALHFHRLAREHHAESEFELRVASGDMHVFDMHSVIFEEGGRVLLLSVCQDITERKAYEEGLIEARREAERLTHLKSQFLANMSHEIRTPLTGIIGFAEIMTQELDGDQREFASIIQASGERLLSTLNSVLDLSKLDSGQLRTQVRPVDLVEVVSDSVESLRAIAMKQGIGLALASEAPHIEAVTDPSLVARLITNLVGNAVKFTHEGQVEVRLQVGPQTVLVAVADTGIGISAEFLPYLFDEFAQESDGMSRDYEGTGLGLAISKRLVDLLQGEINVESQLGKGTTFTVRLPRRLDEKLTEAEQVSAKG